MTCKITVCPHCGSDEIWDLWYGRTKEYGCLKCRKTWLVEAEPEPEPETEPEDYPYPCVLDYEGEGKESW